MAILASEIVLAGIVLSVFLFVAHVYGRRRAIGHESDVVLCGWRPASGARWRPSLLRMTARDLQVFPLFGWTTRMTGSWARRSLDLSSSALLDDDGGLAGLLDTTGRGRRVSVVGVTPGRERQTFDLAVGAAQYTALRYWVESSPSSWPL